MYRILVTEDLPSEALALLAAPDVQADNLRPSRVELRECIGNYDALIVRWMTRVEADLLDRAPHLKVIGRAGASLDNIDLEAASRRGVIVTNTPLMHSTASAEFTLGLLLALARKIPQAHQAVQSGEWSSRRQFFGTELAGKTLGLVGFGRVGRDVAVRAQAFGLDVLAYDPYIDDSEVKNTRVMLVDLDELLRRSDFISLHAPLNEQTKRIIGADEILQMKAGVYLINTARGALIDEDAVAVGVRSGKIAGVAVDAFTREPPIGSPLLGLPNVITTPHLGASTREATDSISMQIVQQTLDALRGVDYRNVVNLPFGNGIEFKAVQPHLVLAEKIGSLQRQLAGGQLLKVEVETRGGFTTLIKPLTMALLKGLLGSEANYVNAPRLAAERGLEVTQAKGLPLADYANLLSCQVSWVNEVKNIEPTSGSLHPLMQTQAASRDAVYSFTPSTARLITGTLFANQEARIVQMDGFRLDGLPNGNVLVLSNDDVPGVIGRVGTLLGDRGINIAEWRLGRNQPGGRALSFINLDTDVPESVLVELRQQPGIAEARVVVL